MKRLVPIIAALLSIPHVFANAGLSGSLLTVAADQVRPLVFFPVKLPVKLRIVTSESHEAPVAITGSFRSALGNLDENGRRDSKWHRDGDAVFLDAYGDYYLRTTSGGIKLLLLEPRRDPLENLITLFDWYCRNTQIGPADVGSFGAPVFRKLFYSRGYPNYICGESTSAFNSIVSWVFELPTRQVNFYHFTDEAGSVFSHSVSEILVGRRWVFFDTTFSVMAERDGRYLSAYELFTGIRNGDRVNLRHNVAKDRFLGPGVSQPIAQYSYAHWYERQRLQHIAVSRFIAPEMSGSADYYCQMKTTLGYDEGSFVPLQWLHDVFY